MDQRAFFRVPRAPATVRPHRLIVVVLALTVFGIASAVAAGANSTGELRGALQSSYAAIPAPPNIAKAGKLTYCIDWNNPPLEFNTGGPKPKGSDPDLGHALATLMGVKDEWHYLSFDGLIAALLAGKCDAILGGVTDTAERRKVVSFTDYASVGSNVMVLKRNAGKRMATLEGLSGKRVGVSTGTIEYDRLVAVNKALSKKGKPKIKFVYFSVSGTGPTALLTGKVDAHYNQAPVNAYAMGKAPGKFAIVSGSFDAAPIGIVTRKEDSKLRAAFHQGVNRLYNTGQMCKILSKWELQALSLPNKRPCR